MEQNNKIMEQLISKQNAQNETPSVIENNDGQVLITTARVINIRYKIHIFLKYKFVINIVTYFYLVYFKRIEIY